MKFENLDRKSEPRNTTTSKTKRRTGRRTVYPTFSILTIVGTLFLTYQLGKLGVGLYREIFPDVSALAAQYPVALGKDRENKRILYRLQAVRPKTWVGLAQIPRQVTAAILMAEDSSFFQHKGYSPEGIVYAIQQNSRPGVKIKRGGSTITQQVVKNIFLTHQKTFSRKIRELLLSVELERKVSKRKILETYLNCVEWGPGIYGIQAAAQAYFKKSANELTAREGATLAFMLPNPARYKNSLHEDGALSDFGSQRVENILEKLWKTGHISDDEYTSANTGVSPQAEAEVLADPQPQPQNDE